MRFGRAAGDRFKHVFARRHLQAAGMRWTSVAAALAHFFMQHKAALGVHRAAKEHGLFGKFVAFKGQFDLLEELAELQFDRAG